MRTLKDIDNRRILVKAKEELKKDGEHLILASNVKGEMELLKNEITSITANKDSLFIRFKPNSTIYPQDFSFKFEYIKDIYSK